MENHVATEKYKILQVISTPIELEGDELCQISQREKKNTNYQVL